MGLRSGTCVATKRCESLLLLNGRDERGVEEGRWWAGVGGMVVMKSATSSEGGRVLVGLSLGLSLAALPLASTFELDLSVAAVLAPCPPAWPAFSARAQLGLPLFVRPPRGSKPEYALSVAIRP